MMGFILIDICSLIKDKYYILYSKLYRAALLIYYKDRIILEPGSRIDHRSQIHIFADGRVELGEGASLRSAPRGYHGGMPFPCTILVDQAKATVVVGSHSRLNGVYVHAQASIRIGKNCVIAAGVNIIDSNGHELLSPNRTTGRDRPEPIEIGQNVWIGINAIVLKGTRVGNNSVIGANSVVSGSFPENSLIVGNPARLVKQLDIPRDLTSEI